MSPTADYLGRCRAIVDAVAQQQAAINQAADWFAKTILAGRMVHVFGSGHSRIMVEEMWPRYGSFPGFNPIVELSLSFHNLVVGANGQRQAMFLENVSGLAERILRNFDLTPAGLRAGRRRRVAATSCRSKWRRSFASAGSRLWRSSVAHTPKRARASIRPTEKAAGLCRPRARHGRARGRRDGARRGLANAGGAGIDRRRLHVGELDQGGSRRIGSRRPALRRKSSPQRADRRRKSVGTFRVRVRRTRPPPRKALRETRPMKEQPLRTTVIGSYPFPGLARIRLPASRSVWRGRPRGADRRCGRDCRARPGRGRARCDHRWRADAARFQSFVLRLSEGIELEPAPPAPFRSARARSARQARGRRGSSRAPRGLGAVEEFKRLQRSRARRTDAQSVSARAVHAERASGSECAISGSLRAHRGVAADRPRRTGSARRRRLQGDHRR